MSARLDGTISLVTGAAGGIGLAIAREISSRCETVILVARSGENLREAARSIVRERIVVGEARPIARRRSARRRRGVDVERARSRGNHV